MQCSHPDCTTEPTLDRHPHYCHLLTIVFHAVTTPLPKLTCTVRSLTRWRGTGEPHPLSLLSVKEDNQADASFQNTPDTVPKHLTSHPSHSSFFSITTKKKNTHPVRSTHLWQAFLCLKHLYFSVETVLNTVGVFVKRGQ